MNKIIINGKEIEINEEGYLADLRDWTPEICNKIAEIDNLVLTDNHWEIINFLRKYGEGRGLWCLITKMTEILGPEKSTKKYFDKLFPANNFGNDPFGYPSLFNGLSKACVYANVRVNRLPVGNKVYEIDIWGDLCLRDRKDWTPEIAKAMAKLDNLELTPKHWAILDIIVEYANEYEIFPSMRVLSKTMGMRLGIKKDHIEYIRKLFPYGSGQLSHYAGLGMPSGSHGTWQGEVLYYQWCSQDQQGLSETPYVNPYD